MLYHLLLQSIVIAGLLCACLLADLLAWTGMLALDLATTKAPLGRLSPITDRPTHTPSPGALRSTGGWAPEARWPRPPPLHNNCHSLWKVATTTTETTKDTGHTRTRIDALRTHSAAHLKCHPHSLHVPSNHRTQQFPDCSQSTDAQPSKQQWSPQYSPPDDDRPLDLPRLQSWQLVHAC